MGASAIVDGEEEEPEAGITAAARTATADYQKRRAHGISAIRFSCTDEAANYINGLSDPSEMWQILKERHDLTTSYIGRTAIVAQFQNARPITGESISVYVAQLQVLQLQLQGSTEEITEQAL